VFARDVRARAAADPRARERGRGPEDSERFAALWEELLLEKQSEIAAEFDAIHTVGRALQVGSLNGIVESEAMRVHLIRCLERAARG